MSRKLTLPNLRIMTAQDVTNVAPSQIVSCLNLDKASLYLKITGTTTISTAITVYVCQDSTGTNPYAIQGLTATAAPGDSSVEIYLTEMPFSYLYVTLTNATDSGVTADLFFTGKTVGA